MPDIFDSYDTQTGAPLPQDVFSNVSTESPRGVVSEIATGIKRGALVDLPKLAGQTLKYVSSEGNPLYNAGESLNTNADLRGQDPNLQLRPEQHGAVVNALASGAEQLPSIAAPIAAAAGTVAAAPIELPTLAAAGLTAAGAALPFAAESGQETLDAAKEKHVPEDKALTAARLNAGLTLASQTGLGLVGGQLFGKVGTAIGKAVNSEAAPLAEQTLAELTGSGGIIKPFLKQLPINAAEAAGVGAVQAGGTTAINNEYGIDDTDPLSAAASAIGPMLGLTAVISPFGLAARALQARTLNARANALGDKETHPEIRDQLATQYFTELHKVDPEAARNFAINADTAIKNKLPLTVDAGLFQHGAITAPAEPETQKLPAPTPIPAGETVAQSPEQLAQIQAADAAAAERQRTQEQEANRQSLVATHEQIKNELTAAGIEPTQPLSYIDFTKAMNKEAKKVGVSLTREDYESMYQKHQNDVIQDNISKANELHTNRSANVELNLESSAPSAEPTALALALQDAIKRRQVDEAHNQYASAIAAEKEKGLNAIQNQTKGAELLAAAENGTLPKTGTIPMSHVDVLDTLNKVKDSGQSLPSTLRKEIVKAVKGKPTLEAQVAELAKLRDSKKPTTASFQLLSQLHDEIKPKGDENAIPIESTDAVDVRQQTRNGEGVGQQNATTEQTTPAQGDGSAAEKSTRGRTLGTTDDRHTVAPPEKADDLYPYHMTLEQAKKSSGGIFAEKAWWQDLAYAVRNPETKVGKELLENGKITDEQVGQALKRDEAYTRQDQILESMRLQREKALRDAILAEAQPEKAKEILDAKTLQNIFGGEESDFALEKVSPDSNQGGVHPDDHILVVRALQDSKTAGELLEKLGDIATLPEQKQLIKELYRIGLDSRVVYTPESIVSTKAGVEGNTVGRYFPAKDLAVIARGGANLPSVLHELIHAATTQRLNAAVDKLLAIKDGKLDPKKLSATDKKQIDAARELMAVFDEAKQRADKLGESHYGLTNIEEFTAESLTDPALQRMLRGETGPKTLWQRLVAAIKSILGLRMSDDMLDRALTATHEFFEAPKTKTNTPEFKRFFAGSKAVDENGQPQVFYHGTGADIDEFSPHQADAIFVTDNPGFASGFSVSREGNPNVIPVYVSTKNPFDYKNSQQVSAVIAKAKELAGDNSWDVPPEYAVKNGAWFNIENPKVQAAIRALGHDGFYVNEAGQRNLAVYKSEQLKSAIGNKGTFSPEHPNILEKLSSTPAALDKFVSSPAGAAYQTSDVLSKIAGLADKASISAGPILTRAHLATTTLNHIRQVFGKLVPGLNDHVAAKDRVEALVKQRNQDAQKITEEMAKLSDKDQRVLYRLMGESSRLNIFPDRPFEDQTWLKPAAKADYRKLSQDYHSSADIKRVYDLAKEHNRKDYEREYAAILRNLGYLNHAPDALWKDVDPAKGFDAKAKALEDWMLTKAPESTRDDLRAAKSFHQQRANSPYFHLGRNGDYFTRFTIANTPEARSALEKTLGVTGLGDKTVIGADDSHVFARYDTVSEWNAISKELQKLHEQGHLDELQSGKLQTNIAQLDSTAPSFIRNMMSKIDTDTRLTDEQKAQSKDLMRRLYVEALPETSASKAFARRSGVAGYDADMRRSFAKRAQASSFFVAHNTVRPDLAEADRTIRNGINGLNTAGTAEFDPKKATVAQEVYNELRKRQANELSPLDTPVLDGAGALGYSWYLAGNPAFILSNLFQPMQLTLPLLGGRHGFVNASKAMFKASGIAFNIIKNTIGDGYKDNKWHGVLDANLNIDNSKATAGEKQALKAMVASGQAEWTQAHELGRVSEGGNEKVNTAAKVGGAFMHYSEALNRITAGLAAYNLEYKRNGGDQAKAVEFAIDTIKNSQFDYSGHNKARAFGKHGIFGPVTPLVSAFMQFNLQTLELLGRLTQTAFKGETPEARAEASKALAGVMATTTMLAGTLGLPFAGLVATAYNNLFSTPDQPVDMTADYRNWLADVFGKETGELVAHGGLRATGLDVASHLDFANIVPGTKFLNDRRQLKDRFDSGALALLGPTVGAAAGLVQGVGKMSDGDYFGGLEMALPTFLKAPIKAADLAENGAKDAKGETLPLDINTWDVAAQALNFTPSKISEQREGQRSVSTTTQLIKQRSSDLQNKLVDALEAQDPEAISQATTEIKDFNSANPDFAIRDVKGIIRARQSMLNIAQQSGVGVEGRARQLPRIQEQARFANTGGMVLPQ